MPDRQSSARLAAEIDEALSLLDEFRSTSSAAPGDAPLPSLLDECRALCAALPRPEPMRSLHHPACSGGTLISKTVAALSGVVLLSEIDPLSTMEVRSKPGFAPTDLLLGLRYATRHINDRTLVATFQGAIRAMHESLSLSGRRLVLRDHTHSHYFTNTNPDRPSVYEMLRDTLPVRSLVTVRHPLDCFIALEANGWRHFDPFTLEEYCRRLKAFLDRHEDLPLIRYEDFTSDPPTTLEQICKALELPFNPLALDLLGLVRLSGDSGRSWHRIETRPRRDVPPTIEDQRVSELYSETCQRLGYTP
ncbi:sulfotransferase family protein [Ensifer sp. T173]|uniref:Sulfotransferase family protein n=1 Tax=Ensifer canadensis TaxID=555315 RepID=A0AAW4FVX0_9HYPH|nr:sulfotransferase [Ensifer canadensis]MBM3095501.1 sulfotransferase family protein [Ensifer canadensis]UBI79099.1 sulfotransferase [Ensifer canadensis]